MTRNEKISATFFLISMCLLFYFGNNSQKKENTIIDKNKFSTIAKVYEIKSKRSFTYARYYFFFSGEKYFSGEYVDNDKRNTINRYYKVELSSVEPEHSRIYLDKEITDSIEIVRAGFTNEPLQTEY